MICPTSYFCFRLYLFILFLNPIFFVFFCLEEHLLPWHRCSHASETTYLFMTMFYVKIIKWIKSKVWSGRTTISLYLRISVELMQQLIMINVVETDVGRISLWQRGNSISIHNAFKLYISAALAIRPIGRPIPEPTAHRLPSSWTINSKPIWLRAQGRTEEKPISDNTSDQGYIAVHFQQDEVVNNILESYIILIQQPSANILIL